MTDDKWHTLNHSYSMTIKIFGHHKQLVPMLRSDKVWQIWCFAMFLSILLPLSRTLTPSLRTIPHRTCANREGDSLFLSFCTIGISMYQKRILPYFIIPSTFSPQASSPLEHSGWTDNILHPLLPKFFLFSLSAQGPTCRRNSTGLAELWGGWPIEQASSHWKA